MTVFGSNKNFWADHNQSMSHVNGQRFYSNYTGSANPAGATSFSDGGSYWGGLPLDWPTNIAAGGPLDSNGDTVTMIVSIQPNMSMLLNGDFDSGILRWTEQAPPGSALALWHEASGQGYLGLTASLQVQGQQHLHSLLSGSNILVGAIEDTSGCSSWMAANLDFYCVDVYGSLGSAASQMSSFVSCCSPAAYSRFGVTETNHNVEADRPAWFQSVWGELLEISATQGTSPLCMLTYWNASGPLSGDWVPSDTATITELGNISGSMFAGANLVSQPLALTASATGKKSVSASVTASISLSTKSVGMTKATPGYNTGTSAGSTTSPLSITIPSTVRVGDTVLLAVATSNNYGYTLLTIGTTGTTWTQVDTDRTPHNSNHIVAWLFEIVAASADIGTTITLSADLTGGGTISAAMASYSNTNTASPIDVHNSSILTNGSTSEPSVSVTTVLANDLPVTAALAEGVAGAFSSTGISNLNDTVQSGTISTFAGIGDGGTAVVASTSIGSTFTWKFATSVDVWATYTVGVSASLPIVNATATLAGNGSTGSPKVTLGDHPTLVGLGSTGTTNITVGDTPTLAGHGALPASDVTQGTTLTLTGLGSTSPHVTQMPTASITAGGAVGNVNSRFIIGSTVVPAQGGLSGDVRQSVSASLTALGGVSSIPAQGATGLLSATSTVPAVDTQIVAFASLTGDSAIANVNNLIEVVAEMDSVGALVSPAATQASTSTITGLGGIVATQPSAVEGIAEMDGLGSVDTIVTLSISSELDGLGVIGIVVGQGPYSNLIANGDINGPVVHQGDRPVLVGQGAINSTVTQPLHSLLTATGLIASTVTHAPIDNLLEATALLDHSAVQGANATLLAISICNNSSGLGITPGTISLTGQGILVPPYGAAGKFGTANLISASRMMSYVTQSATPLLAGSASFKAGVIMWGTSTITANAVFTNTTITQKILASLPGQGIIIAVPTINIYGIAKLSGTSVTDPGVEIMPTALLVGAGTIYPHPHLSSFAGLTAQSSMGSTVRLRTRPVLSAAGGIGLTAVQESHTHMTGVGSLIKVPVTIIPYANLLALSREDEPDIKLRCQAVPLVAYSNLSAIGVHPGILTLNAHGGIVVHISLADCWKDLSVSWDVRKTV